MTSLPSIKKNNKKTPITTRGLPNHSSPELYKLKSSLLSPRNKSSLQHQALDIFQHKRLMYIDFNAQQIPLQLERYRKGELQHEEQKEKIEQTNIVGLTNLLNLSPNSYQMHQFMSEQKKYLEKRKRWKNLIHLNRAGDTHYNLNKLKQKFNPQQLQQFLQQKDQQQRWKKIQQRESKLFEDDLTTSLESSLFQGRMNREVYRGKSLLNSSVRLKTLRPLNILLSQI